MSDATTDTQIDDLVIERNFDAPRELVWQVWTEPEHCKNWWGPGQYTAPHIEIDLKVGGTYLWSMVSPDGDEYWHTGEYEEVNPVERLVFTQRNTDKDGKVLSAAEMGMPDDFPGEIRITVILEDLGDKTKMTMIQSGMPAGDMRDGAAWGWNSSFEKFAAILTEAQS